MKIGFLRIPYPEYADEFCRLAGYGEKLRHLYLLEGIEADPELAVFCGYQPTQKWLKDRKGRILSTSNIYHYRKIIAALSGTIAIQKEIDNSNIVQ
ncbi:hypothetical protein FACS1894164_11780 [Spirochaetia bacterium]|nr:hypothetical protein FACS1894164_11780 [Spirochaetia bacterium]